MNFWCEKIEFFLFQKPFFEYNNFKIKIMPFEKLKIIDVDVFILFRQKSILKKQKDSIFKA